MDVTTIQIIFVNLILFIDKKETNLCTLEKLRYVKKLLENILFYKNKNIHHDNYYDYKIIGKMMNDVTTILSYLYAYDTNFEYKCNGDIYKFILTRDKNTKLEIYLTINETNAILYMVLFSSKIINTSFKSYTFKLCIDQNNMGVNSTIINGEICEKIQDLEYCKTNNENYYKLTWVEV
ncbi:hypothetical protein MYSEV_093 [Mythimna separata entomopoxvirus 'L']|uniref:Uncharacterized protein n=1 Tax=Mythimna separata entomopoxvirus 'L' TaxID=1293572 RepID=A0A916P7A9_9POXV|nr:hypothetical protein MYSEV_093 [Mythimna separata entomopoxvirus 'L']CCU56291.1 hypothetical protein MYSEV_093 [Mythimna separata entomopoxvirus 'L']